MSQRYLLVDDEPLARSRLERLIKEIEPEALCEPAANGPEALSKIERDGPWSTIFLDIEMPGLNGFDVVQRLRASERLPSIIFCTAFPRYAVQAFQESATDYLVKPVESERLKQALAKVSRVNMTQDRLNELEQKLATIQQKDAPKTGGSVLCKVGDKIVPVPYFDIILLRADHKLTSVVTVERDYLSDKSLDLFETELPSDVFFRCHRSALINLKHVLSFHTNEEPHVTLRRNHVVPVSRRKKAELKSALNGT
jgi:DNA-binding LytR/AlgR family response regulator